MITQNECHCGNKQSDPLTPDGFCEGCDESYRKRPVRWFVLINTFPGSSECVGIAISNHRSAQAAFKNADRIQPRLGQGYIPTTVRISDRRLQIGKHVPQTMPRMDQDEEAREWADYAYSVRFSRR